MYIHTIHCIDNIYIFIHIVLYTYYLYIIHIVFIYIYTHICIYVYNIRIIWPFGTRPQTCKWWLRTVNLQRSCSEASHFWAFYLEVSRCWERCFSPKKYEIWISWVSKLGEWGVYFNLKTWPYCWWKKSCTSWYGKYPIIYGVLYIPGGAGFLPSTVWPKFQHQIWVFFGGFNPHSQSFWTYASLSVKRTTCDLTANSEGSAFA